MIKQVFSLAKSAWQWWLAEFRALLPRAFLKRLSRPPLTLLLRQSEATTEITLMADEERLFQETAPHASTSEEAAQLRDTIEAAARRKRFDVVGIIPDQQSLIRPLTMPVAAKAHLEEAVRYQIERLSPFKIENTLYDIKLLATDGAANEIRLKLTIVSKPLVQDLEERGIQLGFLIDRFALETTEVGELEALAFASQAAGNTKLSLATKALLAASLILIASFLLAPILGKWERVQTLEGDIALLKPKAEQVQKLRSERDKLIALRAQVIGFKRASLPPIAMLSRLSDLLDDQSFLSDLRIEGPVVTMGGLSADASKLAQRLGTINAFKAVRFSGPVTRDVRLGRDRFTLILDVAAPQ